jgi:hypothetical protein
MHLVMPGSRPHAHFMEMFKFHGTVRLHALSTFPRGAMWVSAGICLAEVVTVTGVQDSVSAFFLLSDYRPYTIEITYDGNED